MHPSDDTNNPMTKGTVNSEDNAPPRKLKLLSDLGLPKLTPEQQNAFAIEQRNMAAAQRNAMRQWTEAEIEKVIDTFMTQHPTKYAEYIAQEREYGNINLDLGLYITRITKLLFNTTQSIDLNNMFYCVRSRVRASLNLHK